MMELRAMGEPDSICWTKAKLTESKVSMLTYLEIANQSMLVVV